MSIIPKTLRKGIQNPNENKSIKMPCPEKHSSKQAKAP